MEKPVSIYLMWMLRLSFPFRFGKLLAGLLIFFVVWLVLGIVPGEITFYLRVFFAGACGYIVPVFIHTTESSVAAVNQISSILNFDSKELTLWQNKLTMRSSRWIISVTITSIVLWLCHISLLEISVGRSLWDIFTYQQYVSTVGALLVWLTMTFAISALTNNAMILAELGKKVEVDLLRGSGHVVLARVAIMSTFSIIGAQALFVFLVIDTQANWVAFAPGFAITTVPMLALFLIPVWPMHARLKQAKQYELEKIDRHLALLRPEIAVDLNNLETLNQLNQVLIYRGEIRKVSEWPFDIPALIRLGLYLILPPLTWVGAALIENVVDAFI